MLPGNGGDSAANDESGGEAEYRDLTSLDAPSPRLWVRLAPGWTPDPQLRWFIAGSAHTHRGHFHVCSETGDHHRSVNLGDVIAISRDAAIWLNGFLHGTEAGPAEFLGDDEALYDAEYETGWQRWRDWNSRFRARGFGPRLERLPPSDNPRLGELEPPAPWCFIGDLYRVWRDGSWLPADPQPSDGGRPNTGFFWPRSLCEAIGAHEDAGEMDLDYCERCHRIEA